eukprot:Nk52_evm18s2622 gene=Nk52_evmTU18s2622
MFTSVKRLKSLLSLNKRAPASHADGTPHSPNSNHRLFKFGAVGGMATGRQQHVYGNQIKAPAVPMYLGRKNDSFLLKSAALVVLIGLAMLSVGGYQHYKYEYNQPPKSADDDDDDDDD